MKHFGVVVLILLLGGCGWLYQVGGGSSSEFDVSQAGMEVPAFEFTNQEGEPYGTEQLSGQYWLANMIFTNCPTVCPTMTPNVQRLQAAMQEEGVKMSFISFTVDPERDTPEHLKSYGTNVGADLDSWQFLSGYTQEEIADFSKDAFSALVQDIEDSDDIMHSTSFFLVDPEGNVIRKYDGLQADQELMIADLIETVQ
ncbi:SCO family protein [Halalkalibacter nanhaiisediminis]|uniref:Protein SCO1/2 n=1 Tax=Halalkalibacter nanhaiisediminis TaxID=688079 RepID=A0A562QMC7_9BACI|nr:SCO family protein [Halalkalibacter nanhaiisediminis]TWI57206.1 protein SCO1/2 [Halalkalibacter nanhaiisediminis]